jgi:hypothetical protein
MCGELYWY